MTHSLRFPPVSRQGQKFRLLVLFLLSVLLAGPGIQAQADGVESYTGPTVEPWPVASDIVCPNTRKLSGSLLTDADDVVPGAPPDSFLFAELSDACLHPELLALTLWSAERYLRPPFRAPPVR
ncbi:hypothetical protein SAMN04488073_2029 [Marinobacter gudaonensis]|uniref:Uncharacterized protein n=1 Tax=Marinobacter gudaonensis TaxID=375760 RepID=A0A1I6H1K4_9GAMM|nr:hypothetical protein [Marinobacter gudaonensis]SFR48333.1 hypothetical protein SAMN04488073_2029 [Marinobacter gudaonensis]